MSTLESPELENTIHRLKKIRKALNEILLPLRDDSRLAWAFARNQLGPEWNFCRVIHELALNHYMYNYTNYRAYTNDIHIQKQVLVNTTFGGLPERDAKRYTEEFIRDYLLPYRRFIYMINYYTPQEMPKIWPWLLEAIDDSIDDEDIIDEDVLEDIDKKISNLS